MEFGAGVLIPLTQGVSAIVDADDAERVAALKWYAARDRHKSGDKYYGQSVMYLGGGRSNAVNKTVKMHRFILKMEDGDRHQVDRINGNTLDNRKSNLRICTKTQNSWNSPKERPSSSRFKGVHYNNTRKTCHRRWRAGIAVNGKYIRLGSFHTEEEAALAYNEAAKMHHGEFASLNVIEGACAAK